MSKILGIDYGTRDIGLALSDDEGRVAMPWQTISVKKNFEKERSKILEDLSNIIRLEKIDMVVMGMPLNAEGVRTKLGDQVFEFAKELEENSAIKVEVMDERGTSKLASSMPYNNARNIHELSAQIILQDYLDKLNKEL